MKNVVERRIPKYELTIIALVDCSKALKSVGWQNALTVMEFLVKRYVGNNYKIVKVDS